MRRVTVLSIVLLAACSGSEDLLDVGGGTADGGVQDSGGVDSGAPDAGSSDAAVCAIALPEASASEGGLFSAQLTLPQGITITNVVWPDEWRGAMQNNLLTARLPYDEVDTPAFINAEIGLDLSCGASQTLVVEVKSIKFSSLPRWAALDGPDAREHPALFIDPQDPDRLILFGGFSYFPQQFTVVNDLWAYDLVNETWQTLTTTGTPPLRAGGRVAVGDDAIAYHGGRGPDARADFDLDLLEFETDAVRFSPPNPANNTGDDYTLGGFFYDAPRDRFVSVCGIIDNSPSCRVEAYLPSENRWTNVPVDTSIGRPDGRYGYFGAYDAAKERVIVFSGARAGVGGDPVNAAPGTWALDLATEPASWTQLLTDGAPGRRNGCSAFDPEGRRFFVWGGTPDAATTQQGLWVLELDDGQERWLEVKGVDGPAARSSCAAIYDPARKRILFGWGNNDFAVYADWNSLEF